MIKKLNKEHLAADPFYLSTLVNVADSQHRFAALDHKANFEQVEHRLSGYKQFCDLVDQGTVVNVAAATSHLVASVEACSTDTPCDVDTGSRVTGPYEYPGTTEVLSYFLAEVAFIFQGLNTFDMLVDQEHHLVVLVKTHVWVQKEHEMGLMVAVAPKQ
ncbi:hypothetical protein Tco_0945996 [Tanacetum coccineum]